MKQAFTLVEVSISGALIGLCVLTAVAIIPQGLQSQNVSRMKAASAAIAMYLSAAAGEGVSIETRLTAVTLPAGVTVADLAFDSNGAVPTAPAALLRINPEPAAGDLGRRILFSIDTGNNGAGTNTKAITAWLLGTDTTKATKQTRVTYLATYTEVMP